MKTHREKRIVIKVGTNTLTDGKGILEKAYLHDLSLQIIALATAGYQVALVSSGAIRAGMVQLGWRQVRSLRESQAAAAVGQGQLMRMYHDIFEDLGLHVAQILLIADDFRDRNRYLNARNTLLTLFENKVIPIINENDTVAVDEIKFGDNDSLAAHLVGLVDAATLIFLSDVDGLYEREGKRLGKRLRQVERITPEIEAWAGASTSKFSKGGMTSKLSVAKMATEMGAHVFIARGRDKNVIARLLAGEDLGTHFLPQTHWRESRKRWIGVSSPVAGSLIVDDGAAAVLLRKKKSLLAAGIEKTLGQFRAGDVVRILNTDKIEIGRGLTNYGSEEINRIRGLHSRRISQVLGYPGDSEVIHRDNLFTLKGIEENEDAAS